MNEEAIRRLRNLVEFKANYYNTDKKIILDMFRAVYEKHGENGEINQHNKEFFDGFVLEDNKISDDIYDICECLERYLIVNENAMIEELGISTYQVRDVIDGKGYVKQNYVMISTTRPILRSFSGEEDRITTELNEEEIRVYQVTDAALKDVSSSVDLKDQDSSESSASMKMLEHMTGYRDASQMENDPLDSVNTCYSPLRAAFKDKDNKTVSEIVRKIARERTNPGVAVKTEEGHSNPCGRIERSFRHRREPRSTGYTIPAVKIAAERQKPHCNPDEHTNIKMTTHGNR